MQSMQPTSGQDVRLTLDNGIQFMAEHVLADTLRRSHAKGGTAIVEDPQDRRDLRHVERAAGQRQPLRRGAGRPGQQGRHLQPTSPARPSSWSPSPGRCPTAVVTPSTSFVLPPTLRVGDRVDPRRRAARHGAHDGARDPRQVEQHRRGDDRLKLLGKQRLLDWIDALRLRQADRHRLSRRGAGLRPARRPVVGRRRSATCRWGRASRSRPSRWWPPTPRSPTAACMMKPLSDGAGRRPE